MTCRRTEIVGLCILFLLAVGAAGREAEENVKGRLAPVQIEKELLELVNRERAGQGRRPLQMHPVLLEIARSHSEKMALEGRLSHSFPDWPAPEKKLEAAGLYFSASAENVAFSQTFVPGLIHQSFIASVLHRINILESRMTHAGIGVCKWGNDYYITEEFAAFIDPPSASEAMTRLENGIFQWYRERFRVPLVIFTEARVSASILSQQYLMGNPVTFVKGSWGRMRAVNITYCDLDTILAEIQKEITAPLYKSFAVGVTWGRSMRYRGGAYSVSVLLFE